jgi:predicted ATPase
MQIEQVIVRNFRALKETSLSARFFTPIVGPNGAGKSSLLHALDLFFGPVGKKVTDDDYYNRDPGQAIEIEILFAHLPDALSTAAASYLERDRLRIVKAISPGGKGVNEAYHGFKPINPDFEVTRRAPKAEEMKKQYAALQAVGSYSLLPDATTKEGIKKALSQWETENPGDCQPGIDDGTFFGWKSGIVDLSEYVRYVLVPAVREASQEVGAGGTLHGHLQSAYQQRVLEGPEVKAALAAAKEQLAKVARPDLDTSITGLNDAMLETLNEYVPDAKLNIDWGEIDVQVSPHTPTVFVEEDGFSTDVERTGHGLQRAIIMAILQRSATIEGLSGVAAGKPGKRLILGIEEPELFQHPSRQRHFAELLCRAAGSDGRPIEERTQVFFATHSPLFVNIEWFDCVRLMRKIPASDGGPATSVAMAVDVNSVAEKLWHLNGAKGDKWTGGTLKPRLRAILTPWINEGFFARKVVLVEGETDRAAILAAAQLSTPPVELDRLGIAVIPVSGKNNLDRPFIVFSELGIPTYAIWDSDFKENIPDPPLGLEEKELDACLKGKAKRQQQRANAIRINKKYCAMLGVEPEEYPDGVFDHHAAHRVDLETTIKEALGPDLFDAAIQEATETFDYADNRDVLKSPAAMEQVLRRARDNGKPVAFPRLVLDKVLAMELPKTYEISGTER